MLKPNNKKEVIIIGAGLAGCEAALVLARFDFKITLIDMKPATKEAVFSTPYFSELVCSNSLRSQNLHNGAGLLKKELAILRSPLISAAYLNQISIGDSLVVNRDEFSKQITKEIKDNPNIKIVCKKVSEMDFSSDYIYLIATGPCTDNNFFYFLNSYFKTKEMFFYDATAPIIDAATIDYNIAYYKNRFDEDSDIKYLNCPLTKDEYNKLYEKLLEYSNLITYDKVFEGCMPVEVMAKRGYKTLLYGPLKPIGLEQNDKRPYAVVQLRADNNYQNLFNLVGFQTGLNEKMQKEIISLIPGLNKVKVIKYGRMHQSKYLDAPNLLTKNYSFKDKNNIYLIGQINGIEGYIEAIASAHLAALDIIYQASGKELNLDNDTIIGSLMKYSISHTKKYLPIKANFGIMKNIYNDKNKNDRDKQITHAIKIIDSISKELYE